MTYGFLKALPTRYESIMQFCFKEYLNSHVKSKIIFIEPADWEKLLFLPFADWNKGNNFNVWRDMANAANIRQGFS